MHHKATISQGRFENKPFHGQCACGVAGDFCSYQEAYDWAVKHCQRISGIDTSELPAPTAPSDSEAASAVSESDVPKKNEGEAPLQDETVGDA